MKLGRLAVLPLVLSLLLAPSVALPTSPQTASAHTIGCQDVQINHEFSGIERSSPDWSASSIYAVLYYNGSFCTSDVMLHHPSIWVALECRCSDPNAILQIGIISEPLTPQPIRLFWASGGCGYSPLAHEDDPFVILQARTSYEFAIEADYNANGTITAWNLEFGPSGGFMDTVKIIPATDPSLCWMNTSNRKAAWLVEGFDRGDSFGSLAYKSSAKFMEYKASLGGAWLYPTGSSCNVNDRAGDPIHPTFCAQSNRTFTVYD